MGLCSDNFPKHFLDINTLRNNKTQSSRTTQSQYLFFLLKQHTEVQNKKNMHKVAGRSGPLKLSLEAQPVRLGYKLIITQFITRNSHWLQIAKKKNKYRECEQSIKVQNRLSSMQVRDVKQIMHRALNEQKKKEAKCGNNI